MLAVRRASVLLGIVASSCDHHDMRAVGDAPMSDVSPVIDADTSDAALDSRTSCNASGSLDATFATNGLLPGVFGLSPGRSYGAAAVAIDSSGRILVAGDGPGRDGTALTIIRLLSNGAFDPTFGVAGISKVGIDGESAWAEGVAVQTDGKIVAAGGLNGQDARTMLVRFEDDGTLDPTFGTNGVVIEQLAPMSHAVRARLDDTQRIVIAAESWDSTQPSSAAYFTTARYLSTGARDASFDADGIAAPAFQGGQHVPFDLVIDGLGRIDVVGIYDPFQGTSGIAAARYTSDGALDDTFGSGGLATATIAGGGGATGAAIIDSDHLLVAAFDGTQRGVLARFTGGGSLDATFGVGGVSAANGATFRRTIVSADGKVMVVGMSPTFEVAALRYTSAGTLDVGFGISGTSTVDVGMRGVVTDAAIDANGRLIIVGGHGNGQDLDYFVTRLCP